MNERTLIDFFSLQNRWWYDKKNFPISKAPDFKRSDYNYLFNFHVDSRESLVIMGPRGVGKSTVLFQIMQALLIGGTDNKRIFYISFEEPALKKMRVVDILTIYSKYVLREDFSTLHEKIYVFLDEIQNLDNWGDQIKVLQDLELPIKFFISGSSSVAMNNEVSKGARRFNPYFMYPIKFSDFLRYKLKDPSFDAFLIKCKKNRARLNEAFKKRSGTLLYDLFLESYNDLKPWQTKVELLFPEYLIKGGYPAFFDTVDYSQISQDLYDTFRLGFHKDLVFGQGIGDPRSMLNLTTYIASISSNETNYTSLMQNSGSASNTDILKKYLYHLEQSLLVNYSHRYQSTLAKKSSNFKIYFSDIAIRNMLAGLMNELLFRDPVQYGSTVETLVYDHVVRYYFKLRPNSPTYYWKGGKNDLEVDIILKLNGETIPIEVKKADSPLLTDVSGLRLFCKKQKTPGVVLCNQKLAFEENIVFVPYWLFILFC
jgi:hypothetical protein